jgi:hypothetical protein
MTSGSFTMMQAGSFEEEEAEEDLGATKKSGYADGGYGDKKGYGSKKKVKVAKKKVVKKTFLPFSGLSLFSPSVIRAKSIKTDAEWNANAQTAGCATRVCYQPGHG